MIKKKGKKVKERKKTDRNKERKGGKEGKNTMEEIKRNGGTEKYKSGKKMI